MSEVMLKAKSPFVSLLQLLQGSQSLYDIVAACYHIIFVYQHDHELEFINEIDKLADKGSKNNACFNDLEQFRTKMDFLISDVYDESETLLFLNELCELLSHLTCPPRTEKNTFVSFCAFYIMVTSKNPQKYRPIEAFSIIGQILTCKQCFEKVTLP